MTDTRFTMSRGYGADPYTGSVRMDGGMEAARTVRRVAFIGIAVRLFAVYASAYRISVCHQLLGAVNANGELDLISRADAANLVSSGHDADSMVTVAFVASLITTALYLLVLVSLGRRRKRGDTLVASIDANRAIRFATRLYAVAVIGAVGVRGGFTQSAIAMPTTRLDDLITGDALNIGLQLLVIAFLLTLALAVGREIERASDAGRIG